MFLIRANDATPQPKRIGCVLAERDLNVALPFMQPNQRNRTKAVSLNAKNETRRALFATKNAIDAISKFLTQLENVLLQ